MREDCRAAPVRAGLSMTLGMCERMSQPPKNGARKVPKELKAWARLSRLGGGALRAEIGDVGVGSDLEDGDSGGEDNKRAEKEGERRGF